MADEAVASLGEDDLTLPFQVEALDVRGRVVRLGPAIDAILKRHAYPDPVARLLGEAAALTVLIGASLKFDGRLTFQTSSDGPVSMLVVDFIAPGSLRATARYDEDALAAAGAGGKAGALHAPELLGKGYLALTVDQGPNMSRYQGVVALDGESLEAAARAYFMQSEQIPTLMRLAVGENVGAGGERHWRAGGLLLQFLPDDPARIARSDLPAGDDPAGTPPAEPDHDDAWVEAEALAATVADDELLDPKLGAKALLYRLFHERGATVFEPAPIEECCLCSADRLKGIFTRFTDEERRSMVVDDKVEATCEFCGRRYVFTAEEIGA